MSVELTETQQERFGQLMNDAKLLYPGIPENMLEVPIKFYILTVEDDECSKKIEESRTETESIEEIKNIVIKIWDMEFFLTQTPKVNIYYTQTPPNRYFTTCFAVRPTAPGQESVSKYCSLGERAAIKRPVLG